MTQQQEPTGCLFVLLQMLGLLPPRTPLHPPPSATPPTTFATQPLALPEPPAAVELLPTAALPYQRQPDFLTKTERSFFSALQHAVGNQYIIFAKVRLADLLTIPRDTDNWWSHFNSVSAKHVDFLLCDRTAVATVLAIELDDPSHQRAKRQKRDAFLNSALAAAGIPILRVQAQPSYDPQGLAISINNTLQPTAHN